jgi:NADPH:quinone reductase-like Zn-dependent oxidoreductase
VGSVEVPEDLDPAEVLSLLFPYMTAYQVLHRTAKVKSGETILVHGAAGRVGVAALEIGAAANLHLIGTCAARDRAKVEALGAVAIDYRNEDFLVRVRELTDDGVDVVSDSLGGPISLRSFRALRPGGRLVVFGRYSTLRDGHKDWPAVIKWYAAIATLAVWASLSPRRRVSAYHVQKYRDTAKRRGGAVGGEPMDPEQFREDFGALLRLLREGKVHPVVAERLPLGEARRAHELLESSASKGKLVLVP